MKNLFKLQEVVRVKGKIGSFKVDSICYVHEGECENKRPLVGYYLMGEVGYYPEHLLIKIPKESDIIIAKFESDHSRYKLIIDGLTHSVEMLREQAKELSNEIKQLDSLLVDLK